jgi:acylphosphatase
LPWTIDYQFFTMVKRVNIHVSGKVQGVFFRASAKARADELSIRGIVRNELNGSVYIEAEGEEEPLEAFIRWCHLGPDSADVKQCDVTTAPVAGYKDFSIRR